MQISRTQSPARQPGITPVRKPIDGQWVMHQEDFGDTVNLVEKGADKVGHFGSFATYVFQDNTVSKKLSPTVRKSLKKQTLERGLVGAFGGAFVGAAASIFSVLHMDGSFGSAEHLMVKVAAGVCAGVGALALTHAPRKLLRRPEGIPVEKAITGKIWVSKDGDRSLFFRPDGASEKVNLSSFRHAEEAPRTEDGQYDFGQQWWNQPGIAHSPDSWLSVDGSIKA